MSNPRKALKQDSGAPRRRAVRAAADTLTNEDRAALAKELPTSWTDIQRDEFLVACGQALHSAEGLCPAETDGEIKRQLKAVEDAANTLQNEIRRVGAEAAKRLDAAVRKRHTDRGTAQRRDRPLSSVATYLESMRGPRAELATAATALERHEEEILRMAAGAAPTRKVVNPFTLLECAKALANDLERCCIDAGALLQPSRQDKPGVARARAVIFRVFNAWKTVAKVAPEAAQLIRFMSALGDRTSEPGARNPFGAALVRGMHAEMAQ